MATKDRTSLKNDFANGKYATGEKFADLIDSMKVVQLPVVDPQALGTSLSFIDSISQDADGKITATKKTLDLANAHELNPFKGWYKTGDTLPTDGFDGAYLYFKDTSELTGQTTIYRWNGTTYADTGTVVDTSNVQTFGSGQAVNATKIKDESGEEVTGTANVLSAEAGKEIGDAIVVQRWNKLKEYNGSIEISGTNANKIITYQQTKYKVIKVKGGERLITQKGSSASFVRLAVLSEFTYPTTLPYDFSTYFATDETSVRTKTNNDKIEITLPSDARYLIISSKTSIGGDLTPNILNIGGVDYLKNIEEEVVELKEKTATLDSEVVRVTSQSLTDAQKEQARTNIKATADFFDYVELPQSTPPAYYRPNSGSSGWYLSTTNNYRISNLIPIFEGDIIDVIGGYDNNSIVKNLFFNSSAKNNQDLTNAVAEAVLSNGRIEITATMILNGYAYIAFSFNTNDTPTAHATIHRKIKTDIERLDKRIDVINEDLVRELDESSNIIDGYYNYNSSTNKYSLVNTTTFKCTPPISVNIGDVITAYPISENYYPGNPLASAKVVMPKFDSDGNYIGYLTFDELSPTTSNVPKYGKITITQEMYNSGVRAVGFSFKQSQSEGWDVYTPYVKIVRALTGDVDILKREVGRLDTLTENQSTKIEVRKTLHDTSNLEHNEFKVFIPSAGGHRICHKFIRYYKKWYAGTYNIYKHVSGGGLGVTGSLTYSEDVVATDLWNNEYIGIDDVATANSETYIIQGNTNYIYCLPDLGDSTGHGNHVGPGHGCEVAMYQKFFVDGKEIDIDGMSAGESVFCDEFRFLLKGKCFASVNLNDTYPNSRLGTGPDVDEEGNPIVDCYHYMDVLFDLTGKVTVENRLMAAHDDLQFYALFDAMLNCPNGAYKYIAINSDRYKELQNGSWVDEINQDGIGTVSKVDSFNKYTTIEAYNLKAKENQYADTIEMYGMNFYVKHQVIQNDPARRSKQLIHRGGYSNQMKAYYSSVGQFETDNTDDVETFNEGDVISVTHIREISLVADIDKYYHSVVVDIPNVTYICDEEYVTDESFKITLTANSGYSLPENIVVSPNSINFEYDNTTGEISFPDGINVPITITKPTTT